LAIDKVKAGSSIIDIGSSNGSYLNFLKNKKKCYIKTVNKYHNLKNPNVDEEEIIDLDFNLPKNIKNFEYIFLLDIIEHLKEPEIFVKNLYNKLDQKHKVIASTGNISFIIIRLMLFFGFFNYGNRGILDKTHTRLFTFSSFKKLFINYFDIEEIKGIPVPFPLALGENIFARLFLKINILLIKISKPLFSYQIFLILRPKPSLKNILKETIKYSESIK
jgi:hypothetical protein